MIDNSFSEKMQKKTDQELEMIFSQKEDYTEEAIEAVVIELVARNLLEEEEVLKHKRIIEEKLKFVVKEELTISKRDNADESSFEELLQPELYSKKAIQAFTIFFSTIFGTVLLMYNLKVMKKPKARIQVLVFAVIYIVFTGILLNVLPKIFFITLIFNFIGYAFLAEYFWNTHLGKDLAHRKKGVAKPLIISLLISGFFFLLIFLPIIMGIEI